MNPLELEALQTPISNLARVVYCVYLRPKLSRGSQQVVLNNKDMLSLLNSKTQTITKGREINALLKELNEVGLIALSDNANIDHSMHNKTVNLPLSELPQSMENPQYHSQHKAMQLTWRPVESIFIDLCKLIGLLEHTYSADELGEFIAYWLGRVDSQHTEYQWTQKLVVHLKQRRQRLPLAEQKTATGHQYVTPSAGIVFDDNVAKLINQYKDQA
ncbi:MAG: DnaT-like ssDNA-binding domain-containing protein [Glaciecola sp.]